MGDPNQLSFINRNKSLFKGPFLEVGSHDYGETQALRPVFAGEGEYVGLDMIEGPGVDLTLDLTLPFDQIDAKLNGQRFGTIFCLSVMEHCAQPFLMAQNMTKLLAPGGRICISVPFAWEFHGYPSDYWRFTHEGVKLLFPDLAFDDSRDVWCTSRPGDFHPLDKQIGRIAYSTKPHFRAKRYLRGLCAGMFRFLAKIGLFRWMAGYPYTLAPTGVFMIGTLKSGEAM